jgi:PAS domain S-box-containing protein
MSAAGEGPFSQWSERPALVHPEGQELAHRLGVAVYVAEPGADGRWLHASPAVSDMIGLTSEALVADPDLWLHHLHPDDRDEVLARESRLQVDGRVRSEYRMIRPDGTIVWLVDDAALARTADGRVVLDGFLVDVTEQKRAQLMLATQAELVEAVSGPTDLADVLADLARGVMGVTSAQRCVITVQGLPPVCHPAMTSTLPSTNTPMTPLTTGGDASRHTAPVMSPDGTPLGCVALLYTPGGQPPGV